MNSTSHLNDLLVNKSFHDYIEYPWSRCYMALLRKSVKRTLLKTDYVFSENVKDIVRENWDLIEKKTLLDPFRLGKLVDLLFEVKDLEGDILECGSYKGGSGILMAILLKRLGSSKKVHLFDSFAGLPKPDDNHDKGYKEGQFLSDFDQLSSVIETLELSDFIVLHKGWFNETIPKFINQNSKPISLFHIDCDLYTSTMDCFPQIYDLMNAGSVIVLDDYNDGGRGEKKAIKQVLYELNKEQMFYVSYGSQSYFYKDKLEEGETIVKDGIIIYNLDTIFQNVNYLSWLEENLEEDYYAKFKSLIIK